jgi:hypothetical protein
MACHQASPPGNGAGKVATREIFHKGIFYDG